MLPGIDEALERAAVRLLTDQHADGYWVADLECDASVTAEALFLRHLLGRVNAPRQERMVRWILKEQNAEGGWAIYQDGPSEVNATLKCYLALKLAGLDPDNEPMTKAREVVLRLGGLEACHLFTHIYLAWGGLYSWDRLPHLPIEILQLPSWIFSRYDLSYWARTILVPLLVTLDARPTYPLGVRIDELSMGIEPAMTTPSGIPGWLATLIQLAEGLLEGYGRLPLRPGRRAAIAEAERWMLERFEGSDGLGAIWPAMVNATVALKCLGHDDGSPAYQEALRQLDGLETESPDGLWVQPCFSPVWDTVWCMKALAACGLASDHPALIRAGQWTLSKQAMKPGDWLIHTREDLVPAGWYFQFNNEFYPDVDDTAAALMALNRTALAETPEARARMDLALDWICGMQNPDGGWGAFDRSPTTRDWLNHFSWARPFDGALLDPSTADVSARCVEALGKLGHGSSPAARKGLAYLRKEQEPDGSWFGRWGVNYVYGTWSALCAFQACGVPTDDPAVRKAVAYLERTQLPDGSWGETCETYADPATRGRGPGTASQTAWGLMALIAAGQPDCPAATRAAESLLSTQRADGTWHETGYTGTGFPRVFYLRYTWYARYFPALALGRLRACVAGMEARQAVTV